MTPQERTKVFDDPDYISSKRYNYSLRRFLRFHDREVPDSMIAALLKITTDEVVAIYNRAVSKCRDKLDLN